MCKPNPDEPELRNYALRDLGINNKLVVLNLNLTTLIFCIASDS
jgi:hypothetical protein